MRSSRRTLTLAIASALLVGAIALGWLAWTPQRRADVLAANGSSNASAAAPAPPIAGSSLAPADPIPSAPAAEAASSARETVVERSVAAAVDATSSEETALVRVLVVGKQDGAPRTGVRILASTDAAGQDPMQVLQLLRRRDVVHPTTGADGRAEIEIPAGVAHAIHVHDPASGRGTRRTVAALAPGETRELTVEIDAPGPDRRVVGQLVDAETGAPVEGEVRTEHSGGHSAPVPTAADGRFELRAHSSTEHFASAFARGYAQVVFDLAAGHEDPAAPRIVRMSRAATIDAFVRDPRGNPVAGARVELATEAYRLQTERPLGASYYTSIEDMRWFGSTDANGMVTIGELPPRVPLRLATSISGWPQRDESEPIDLAPGEQRTIDIVLGVGASIVGALLDDQGAPIVAHTIWRAPADHDAATTFQPHDEPVASATTDREGRFHFDTVPLGAWHVGPAPSDGTDVPARAELVRVASESSEIELVLRVTRGLYVSGQVVDPNDRPVPGCWVSAFSDDRSGYVSSMCDGASAFRLGPLSEGDWMLRAQSGAQPFADSELVSARAGASDVVLRLQRGGGIRVEVVDARSGAPRACEISVIRPDPWTWTSIEDAGGKAEFEGLVPGSYAIYARADADVAFRDGVIVDEAAVTDAGRLELAPGARIAVRYAGPAESARARVLGHGVTLAWLPLEGSTAGTVTVPAGPIELRWRSAIQPDVEHVERVEAVLDREVEVVLREPR